MDNIVLDSRVGSSELLPLFPPNLARTGKLQFGDASFMGQGPGGIPAMVGVERKTIQDFVHSIETGRLQGHQLPGLMASYNYIYIILEGIWRSKEGLIKTWSRGGWQDIRCGREKGLTSSALDGLMNTISILSGVTIRQSSDSLHTVDIIVNLWRWWQKEWDKHTGNKGFQHGPRSVEILTKPSLIRRMAKELPGIGWERSRLVSNHFQTVLNMVLADEWEWEEIEGIGSITANNVVEAMRKT